MKVTVGEPGEYQVEMTSREKSLLAELIKLYPLMPASQGGHPNAPVGTELSAGLLREALAGHRHEVRQVLVKILAKFAAASPLSGHWHASFNRADMEALLQGLNDVRVGSWIRLGSPDFESKAKMEITSENAHYFWAMELCGAYQSAILHGMDGAS